MVECMWSMSQLVSTGFLPQARNPDQGFGLK